MPEIHSKLNPDGVQTYGFTIDSTAAPNGTDKPVRKLDVEVNSGAIIAGICGAALIGVKLATEILRKSRKK